MSEKPDMSYDDAVSEVRKACRHFAMLYFNFCKVLVESLGFEKAKLIIQEAVFDLALDRTDQLRKKAEALKLDYSLENFEKVNDLPQIGWEKERGREHCPYAEAWWTYFEEYPWFRELAILYCNVIDTTNIENFTRCLSHRNTKNVLKGQETCQREYYPDEAVQNGTLTFGKR